MGSYYSLYSTGGSNAIRINVGAAIEGLFNTGTNNHVIDDYISFICTVIHFLIIL